MSEYEQHLIWQSKEEDRRRQEKPERDRKDEEVLRREIGKVNAELNQSVRQLSFAPSDL